MAALKSSILLLFLMSACSQATQTTKVTVNNNLSSCIKIDEKKVVYKQNMPVLNASYQQLKPTSECGCKSAISAYSSHLQIDGYQSQLLTAKFNFSQNKLALPLATSKEMIGDYNILVDLHCSTPD